MVRSDMCNAWCYCWGHSISILADLKTDGFEKYKYQIDILS